MMWQRIIVGLVVAGQEEQGESVGRGSRARVRMPGPTSFPVAKIVFGAVRPGAGERAAPILCRRQHTSGTGAQIQTVLPEGGIIQGRKPLLLLTDQEGAPAPSSRSGLPASAGLPRLHRFASLRGKIKQPALCNGISRLINDTARVTGT